MVINDNELQQLTAAIVNGIRDDFAIKFVTHSLADTIVTEFDDRGAKIRIPAVRYDKNIWNERGIVRYTPEEGSYAMEVDESGGYSRTHAGYAERAIEKAWSMFAGERNAKYDITVVGD